MVDIDVLKTLLDCQDKAYKGALELFLKQVNDQVKSCETSVKDLTRSLEFTQNEVDELRGVVNQLKQDKEDAKNKIKSLTDDLQAKNDKIKELEEKSIYQEDYNRRNNLQIFGLAEEPRETWEKTAEEVSKLLERKLQLPRMEIERAHRIGQQREQQDRPVIVRFSRFADREAVLRNCSKLRGTNIFINEDLSPSSQAIKREKMPLLRQARMEGKIAYFRHTKLIVKERHGMPSGSGNEERERGETSVANESEFPPISRPTLGRTRATATAVGSGGAGITATHTDNADDADEGESTSADGGDSATSAAADAGAAYMQRRKGKGKK